MIFGHLDPRRFNALAGYSRSPEITLISVEIAWFSDSEELVLGVLILDLIDHDYGWVVLGRDGVGRYRAVNVMASYATVEEAEQALMQAMTAATTEANAPFLQGDEPNAAIDFFAPVIRTERRNQSFEFLRTEHRFTPAREIIMAMMRYHDDIDGNFVENFQASGFDARIWELYIWATFTELGFVRESQAQVPDFILRSVRGRIAVEATTINPSDNGEPAPATEDEAREYLDNYVPIRIAKALRKKLNHKPPYWESANLKDVPFCIALQDFHAPMSMQRIVYCATLYVFGFHHSLVDGKVKPRKAKVHRFGKLKARSGFFDLEEAKNVSAIILNPQGTMPKFNRLGFAADFGSDDIKMVRQGMKRNENNTNSPMPTAFRHVVDKSYDEKWVEGMVVLHNPNALNPLDPELIPGAAHEFLQDDGRINSLLPKFHPLLSQTKFLNSNK